MAFSNGISKAVDAARASCRRPSRGILVGVAFMLSLMANQMVESFVNHVPFTTIPSSPRVPLAMPDAVRTFQSTKEGPCMATCQPSDEGRAARVTNRRELLSQALRSVAILPCAWAALLPSSTWADTGDANEAGAKSDPEISYDDFQRYLLKGEVVKCDFIGANFNKAIVELADGTRAVIGEGYPRDLAFTDDSPLKVVAMLRNAGVPFTTQFNTKQYAKPKSYKTVETLQAEARQREEDEALERLTGR